MTDEIRLTIEPQEAQLEYDRPAEFTVTVQNLTGQVDAFSLSVVGLSPQYVRFDPPRLSKFPAPERSATSKLTVIIPKRAKVPARRHTIGVKAQSSVDPALSRVEEVRVDFPAVDDLVIEAVPRVVTSGGRGKFRIRAVNRGSVPKQVSFVGTDSEEAVSYTFDPPSVLVPPFGSVEAVARVKARRPLSGGMAQRSLVIRSVDRVGASQEAQATFMQRPLLRKPVLRLGALGAIVAAAAAAWVLTRPTPVTLSDYTQQAETDVQVALDSLGLDIDIRREPSALVAAGLVLETNPRAGAVLDPGSLVVVIVSSGPEVVQMPDLTGVRAADVDAAINDLLEMGFDVRTSVEPSKDVPIGEVTRTRPAAFSDVTAGDQIDVFISDGIEVPNVVGRELADALGLLAGAGLADVERIGQTTTNEGLDNVVNGQNPPAGDKVSFDRRVVLTFFEFEAPPETTTSTPGD